MCRAGRYNFCEAFGFKQHPRDTELRLVHAVYSHAQLGDTEGDGAEALTHLQ